MQFKVPQDVQREDQIIGPLTLKQMGILGIGGGTAYAIYVSLARSYYIEVWLPPVAIVGALTLALAFLKVHGLPFHRFLMNFTEYKLLNRQRFWIQSTGDPFYIPSKEDKKETKKVTQNDKKTPQNIAEISKVLDNAGQPN